MKTNLNKYKFALFSALVVSMIIPFAGISIAHATPTNVDPYHIGKVVDGTYNETAALQRVTQLMNMRDVLLQEKQILESQLANTTNPTDIKTINMKIENVTGQIGQIMQEFNSIQTENLNLYYIDPTLLKKYQTASDDFTSKIQAQYWDGKSTFEDKKNAFPLVSVGINGKTKSVEIILWKGIENSTKADRYNAIINQLMPKDIPWFVSYGEYPVSYVPILKQNSLNVTSTYSPLKQLKLGIAAQNVKCNEELQLIFKAEDGSPACVKVTTAQILIQRGWGHLP